MRCDEGDTRLANVFKAPASYSQYDYDRFSERDRSNRGEGAAQRAKGYRSNPGLREGSDFEAAVAAKTQFI